MKKIPTSQLAEILDIDIHNIYPYRKRGKIRLIKDGGNNLIDLHDPLNKKFILEQAGKKGISIDIDAITPNKKQPRGKHKTETNEKIPKTTKKRTVTTKKIPKTTRKQPAKPVIPYISELEKHRTEKMKHDAELSRMKFEREAGRILPKDLTEQFFINHFNNASKEFYNAADNYTIIVNDRLGGKKEDLVFFRSKLVTIIDEAINEALKNSIKDMEKVCKEFSKNENND